MGYLDTHLGSKITMEHALKSNCIPGILERLSTMPEEAKGENIEILRRLHRKYQAELARESNRSVILCPGVMSGLILKEALG